ncbi:hypothetical protein QFZ37_002945 [Chryseobacterium ginsenosidimutans]|uniref:DUF2971 domain-containing protein n=1 Tax=Chryseobacterium ginsenosidimutans TaxID=687846 RepID=UPI0027880B6A|nr:DUF2971 domain-containing protein [Chryseobacterium ginsenosidimutans]MDQ0594576.1 hypothetical protein [Chryseobacterium ginsenosidimutans]
MLFFIPTISAVQADSFLNNSIIPFIESYGYEILKNKKIYSITFIHNGKEITDTVNCKSVSNNEVVFVILETKDLFLVCTTKRGITGGEPMITAKKSVLKVIYFDDVKLNSFKYGDWVYKLENGNHEVEAPKEAPKSVFKYYSNNLNSRNALINQYLFCSHPYHLNDSMDSTDLLWDFSNLSEALYLKFYDQYDFENSIEINYLKEKENGFKQIKHLFYNMITNCTGIISLTTQPLHTLMWAHYSTEKGFMIELDWEVVKNNLPILNDEITNYVFFPIQYVENLESIDFFLNNCKSPDVPFLYSIGVKRNDWRYEDEWRFVTYSQGYGIPNSLLSPFDNIQGIVERKVYYPKDAIKSITLGKQFFNGENVEELIDSLTYKIKNSTDDLEFINFLIENFNDRIYLCGEYEKAKKFTRSSERISFKKIDNQTINIERH